jgi:quinol monooxygenase YgiN
MPVTLTATWIARPGEEAEVERILRTMVPLTQREPGCVNYIAMRSQDEPREFMLFEQYADDAAFEAHTSSEYFKEHVLEDALPRLEDRVRRFYTLL